MSVADDIDCVQRIVQESEKLICGQITKLKREVKSCNQSLKVSETKLKEQDVKIHNLQTVLKAQDQKIILLQTENQSLQEQVMTLQTQVDNANSHSTCKATMQKAFASALQSILPDSNVPVMDMNVTDISVVHPLPPEPMSYVEVTSTPQQLVPVPGPQLYQACTVNLGKRKFTQVSSATSGIYTEMESLPEDIRKRLEPFSKESKCSTRDKLNTVQRAFVKYKVNELKKTGQKVTDAFIQAMIEEGGEDRIWSKDFKPSGDVTFFQYIYNRIKNERKIMAREELLKNTSERITSFLGDVGSVDLTEREEEDVTEDG